MRDCVVEPSMAIMTIGGSIGMRRTPQSMARRRIAVLGTVDLTDNRRGWRVGSRWLTLLIVVLGLAGFSASFPTSAVGADGHEGHDHPDPGPVVVPGPTFDQRNVAPTADNPLPAIEGGFDVQVIYFIPQGARQDRRARMLDATRVIRDQWRGWGWTFDLVASPLTVSAPRDCSYYSGERVYERISPHFRDDLIRRGLWSATRKYVIFSECVVDNQALAWGGGNEAFLLNSIINGVANNENRRIGTIGHELGHTFGLTHENCAVTNGPMCEANWPNVSPTANQRQTVFGTGCAWIAECNGASVVRPVSCWAARDANNQVRVTWTRSNNDNASGFVIRRSRNGGSFNWVGRSTASPFLNNLTQSGTYRYSVETVNASGRSNRTDCGPTSGVTFGGGGGAVRAPVSCFATRVAADQVRITWTRASNDNANDFVIHRSRNGAAFRWAGRVGTGPFLNTGVPDGSHVYRVAARNGAMSSSPRVCGPAGGVAIGGGGDGGGNVQRPIAPVSCWAVKAGVGQVRVTWTRASADRAGDFVIRRSFNGGSFNWAGRADASGWTNTGVTRRGSYRYRVEARNAAGNSDPRVCGPFPNGITVR